MPAAICPWTKHETIPCILGENVASVRSVSCQWSLPACIRRCHPRTTLARAIVTFGSSNDRSIVRSFHCRNKRREIARIGVYLKPGFVAFRCVFIRKNMEGSPIAAARFYDGKVNSLLQDVPFVARPSLPRACNLPAISLRHKGILRE